MKALEDTFKEEITGFDTPTFLGDMYARWTLDCLIEIAHAVSIDYFSSPEYYQGEDTPNNIVDLWLAYGSAEGFPKADQRHLMAAAVFGDSDGYPAPQSATIKNDSFHQNRDPLFAACVAVQTASAAQARPGLEQQVALSLTTFRNYLIAFRGKAARLAFNQLQVISNLAYEILRSESVASRFIGKRRDPISKDWPLQQDDPAASILIPEILSQLTVEGVNPQLQFPVLRAVAQSGNDALEQILKVPPKNLDELIQKTYSWATFLQNYRQSTTK